MVWFREGSTFIAIGVLFGWCVGQIEGDSWLTWWFNHLPGPLFTKKKDTYVDNLPLGDRR